VGGGEGLELVEAGVGVEEDAGVAVSEGDGVKDGEAGIGGGVGGLGG
jgi:hypothetical protein